MTYRVHIPRAISRRLRAAINIAEFGRDASLRFWAGLRTGLEEATDTIVNNRVPGRPECFYFRRVLNEGGTWHKFTFYVSDQERPGELVVVDFRYDPRPRSSG